MNVLWIGHEVNQLCCMVLAVTLGCPVLAFCSPVL